MRSFPTQTILGFCDGGEGAESCHRHLSQLLAASLHKEEGNEFREGSTGALGQTGGIQGCSERGSCELRALLGAEPALPRAEHPPLVPWSAHCSVLVLLGWVLPSSAELSSALRRRRRRKEPSANRGSIWSEPGQQSRAVAGGSVSGCWCQSHILIWSVQFQMGSGKQQTEREEFFPFTVASFTTYSLNSLLGMKRINLHHICFISDNL